MRSTPLLLHAELYFPIIHTNWQEKLLYIERCFEWAKFFFNKMNKSGGFPIRKWVLCVPCVSLCAILVRFTMGNCWLVCRNGDLVFILKEAMNDSIFTMFYRPFQSGAHSRHLTWRFDAALIEFGDFELIFKFKVTR